MSALAGQHALITGGGTGIGAAIAHALADAGAAITVAGRRKEPLDDIVKRLPKAAAVTADVTRDSDCADMMTAARAAHGPVDIVIANAGAADSAPFGKIDDAHWERMISVNLTGAFHTVKAAQGDVTRKRQDGSQGRIVFIASTAGLKGYPYVAAYCAAKHGVIGLMRALSVEFARHPVTVNAVCPGFTETPLLEESVANIVAKTSRSQDAARAELARANPQGRFVTPQEVAQTALWLCLPTSSAITGQAISVSGRDVSTVARLRAAPLSASKQRLRLWLRLLRASRAIEAKLRDRLRTTFDITLPQFDVMAALARHDDGMTMSALSRELMVSNGNVTGIIDRLATDKLVLRKALAEDRRTFIVRLTPKGAAQFDEMAKVHEQWIDDMLSDVGETEAAAMIGRLDGLTSRVRNGVTPT